MSHRKMVAMPNALKLLREALAVLREAPQILQLAEISIRDATAEKREHMLRYLDDADTAIHEALFRTSVAVAEAAHLTVEDQPNA